jgi:hypothetical protein
MVKQKIDPSATWFARSGEDLTTARNRTGKGKGAGARADGGRPR